MAEIEMVIDSIRVSLMNYQRVVVLKEKDAERYLPIWIGCAEADPIALKMQGIHVPRPLTHDLICSIANVAGLKIKRVVINKLKNDTYYAKLVMTPGDKSYEIDCRPSDALAVAVRVSAPIFADEKILEKAGVLFDAVTGQPVEQPSTKNINAVEESEKKPSPYEIFSESAQNILSLAENEAKSLNHDYIGTGHILLALVKGVPTIASEALKNLGIDLANFRVEIVVALNQQSSIESGEGGLSSAVKRTIELSVNEAKRLSSEKVQPEHILLGLIQQEEGLAANLLKNLGIDTERIYIELIRLYNQPRYEQQPPSN